MGNLLNLLLTSLGATGSSCPERCLDHRAVVGRGQGRRHQPRLTEPGGPGID